MKRYIGVDLGGTSIKAGAIEGDKIVHYLTHSSCAAVGGEETLRQLYLLIEQLITTETVAIGIGVPSVVDRKEGIVYNVQNIKDWDKVQLRKLVEERFSLPTYIDNDANCFAMGERIFGAGRAFDHFVGVTLGTGVGGGIIQGGRLLEDANCGSGEFGELPYKDSILEAYCASAFFVRNGAESGAELFEKAAKGDDAAIALFNQFGLHIAALIKIIVLTIDPQAIIIGGSISRAFPLFEQSLRKELLYFPYPQSIKKLTIITSTLQHSGVLGAAALCLQQVQPKAIESLKQHSV